MFARVLKLFTSVKIGTLVTTDYGLRTTDGRHFWTGTRHMGSVVPMRSGRISHSTAWCSTRN